MRAAQLESKTKQVTLVKTYPTLAQFPYAVQKIVATEESKVAIRFEQHIPTPVREKVDGIFVCHCLFSRRYRLPCQHIFHIDRACRVGGGQNIEKLALTQEVWKRYLLLFGDGGMEMYESPAVSSGLQSMAVLVPDPGKTLRVLKLGEVNERIRSIFYKFEEQDSQLASHFINTIEHHLATLPKPAENHSLHLSPPCNPAMLSTHSLNPFVIDSLDHCERYLNQLRKIF